MVTTHPINTRNGFGGGFIGDYIGDYTDLAVGSDNTFHAFWTDTNNKQNVVWFYGFEFTPTPSTRRMWSRLRGTGRRPAGRAAGRASRRLIERSAEEGGLEDA
jgi:hypothetical protein